jgi:hypothetical protein
MGSKCTIFIDDLPRMLPTKFWFIWPNFLRKPENVRKVMKYLQCLKWGRKYFFWTINILVTGPNGIMVGHKFCDIFLWKKDIIYQYINSLLSPSDRLASFLETTLANGIKVVEKVITSKFGFHLIAIYALGCFRNFSCTSVPKLPWRPLPTPVRLVKEWILMLLIKH